MNLDVVLFISDPTVIALMTCNEQLLNLLKFFVTIFNKISTVFFRSCSLFFFLIARFFIVVKTYCRLRFPIFFFEVDEIIPENLAHTMVQKKMHGNAFPTFPLNF